MVAHFVYTDYKDCVIVEIPYDGDRKKIYSYIGGRSLNVCSSDLVSPS